DPSLAGVPGTPVGWTHPELMTRRGEKLSRTSPSAISPLPHQPRNLRDRLVGRLLVLVSAGEHDEDVRRLARREDDRRVMVDAGDVAGLVGDGSALGQVGRDLLVELLRL